MFEHIWNWFEKDNTVPALSDAEIAEIERRPIALSVLNELRSAPPASSSVESYVDHDNWALVTNSFK